MVKKQSCQKDFPVVGFVADTPVQVTRVGDLIVSCRVTGIDPECLTALEREQHTDRFAKALSDFGTEYRIYQTLFSERVELDEPIDHPDEVVMDKQRREHQVFSGQDLFQRELYFSFVLQASPIHALALGFSVSKQAKFLLDDQGAKAQMLLAKVQCFVGQLAKFLPIEILSRQETKHFLAKFVRFRWHNRFRPIPQNDHLDFWLPNGDVEFYSDCVWSDGHYLKALTLRDAPRQPAVEEVVGADQKQRKIYGSFSGIFASLLSVNAQFIASVEWHVKPNERMRKHLVGLQKSFDSQIVSWVSQMFAGKNDTRSDMRQDTSAVASRNELGYALVEQSQNNPFGEYSCSVVLFDDNLDKLKAAVPGVVRAFSTATVTEEDNGVFDAWIASIPGNYYKNVRYLYTTLRAAADMSFLWAEDVGIKDNSFLPGGRSLCYYRTKNGGLYHFAPNVGQVVGIVAFGAQGSGKTTNGNNFVDQFHKLWVRVDGKWQRPKTFIMDMKDSYRENTLNHGGVYRALSLDNPGSARRNPWALPYSKDAVERIVRLIQVMIEGQDGFVTTPQQNELITRQVEDKYMQKERGGLRLARLGNLNLGAELQARLAPWIGNGQYAAFFDNDFDHSEESDWLTCEYSGFEKYPHVLLPLLYWDFQWFDSIVRDPMLAMVPKLALCDELHVLMMMSKTIGPWMLERINTGRSFNLWNMFIMQWAALLQDSALGRAITDACPMKIFAASPTVPIKKHVEIFGMSEAVAEAIHDLQPAKEILVYTANGAKVLGLPLDEKSRTIYANDHRSTARRYDDRSQGVLVG